MVDSDGLERTLDRMSAEYLEMPGLRLTVPQARRLWGLDEPTCRLLLNALLDCGFLRVTRDDTYARATDGPAIRPRPVKATLRPTLQNAASRS